MKVGSSEPIADLPRPATPAQAAPPPIRDRHTATAASMVGAAQRSVEEVRVARVQELAAQIKSGSYQPSAQQIANAILDAALVDAQLEAAG